MARNFSFPRFNTSLILRENVLLLFSTQTPAPMKLPVLVPWNSFVYLLVLPTDFACLFLLSPNSPLIALPPPHLHRRFWDTFSAWSSLPFILTFTDPCLNLSFTAPPSLLLRVTTATVGFLKWRQIKGVKRTRKFLGMGGRSWGGQVTRWRLPRPGTPEYKNGLHFYLSPGNLIGLKLNFSNYFPKFS